MFVQIKYAAVQPIFSFPGGRRFHFCDPSGNEYAVWQDMNAVKTYCEQA
ncbi:MAG: hypothetical protein AAFV72_26595 [Cyanobacteria bacterium J06635_1]